MKRSRLVLILSILSVLAVGTISCDTNRIIDQNVEIENGSWNQEDVKSFKFEILDTIPSYNVQVNLRNTSTYAYSNLYLFVELESPSGKFFKDTLEITLADKNGRWLGSGVGNIWQNQIDLVRGVRMNEIGEYSISVSQGMREKELNAISNVGIRVEINE